MINKEHNKFLYYCAARPFWIVVGYFLHNNPTWAHIRKHCFNFPGQNCHVEIKKHSKLLFHLNAAYNEYFEFKHRKLPQTEWQKIHWNDYGETGYKMLEEPRLNEDFYQYMDDMALKTGRILEIGCGGFGRTRELAKRYPQIGFVGYDISNESQILYEREIQHQFKNIAYKRANILDEMDAFSLTPFFFTYLVLMHFDPENIHGFFHKLSVLDHPVYGILREPVSETQLSFNYKSRDYKHNYKAYLEKYGFHLLGSTLTESGMGTFYFKTK
ncbi:MAG: hypothetical protein COV67_12610 [Nitrospinae bacterium CG11_big_fil_rev_8_21_14_0_20_56_8]|nr:MAG: hypothetical protein COV67_12610 [Nitrospinae bacterium CG11_big_fil_rev_8_21_14_0_20_56_8]